MRSDIFLVVLLLLCITLFVVDIELLSIVKALNISMKTVVVYSENSDVKVEARGEIHGISGGKSKAFTLFVDESLNIKSNGEPYVLRFLNNVYEVSIREIEVRLGEWDR